MFKRKFKLRLICEVKLYAAQQSWDDDDLSERRRHFHSDTMPVFHFTYTYNFSLCPRLCLYSYTRMCTCSQTQTVSIFSSRSVFVTSFFFSSWNTFTKSLHFDTEDCCAVCCYSEREMIGGLQWSERCPVLKTTVPLSLIMAFCLQEMKLLKFEFVFLLMVDYF